MTTYDDIANNFDLWGQYVDPQGLDSREDFERRTIAEKLEFMAQCYGTEDAYEDMTPQGESMA